jgi:hypothetical protein
MDKFQTTHPNVHNKGREYPEKNMLKNVMPFPTRDLQVSKIRTRDEVLKLLLPKFLGVIWSRGEPGGLVGSVQATLHDDLELGGFELSPGAYCIHAYTLMTVAGTNTTNWQKVFSAHLGSRAVIDGVWPYWHGRCRVLSWQRGTWEDRVVAEQVEPRTVAHLLHAGLAPRKMQSVPPIGE